MNIDHNINLFKELIRCGSEIYTWCYDSSGQLICSNCPDEELFATAFSMFGVKEKVMQKANSNTPPLMLGTAFGLIWGVDFEKDNDVLKRIHVIGPAFFTDLSEQDIENSFHYYNNLEISLTYKHRFFNALQTIPVAQNFIFMRYILMLHYCLTEEKLDASMIYCNEINKISNIPNPSRDRHKIWQSEQAMLKMVRDGNLNYKEALNASIMISPGIPVKGKDALRQAKTSVIVFVSLVCRAAIEGGLSPAKAYSLGDYYIQTAESGKTYDEISAISMPMYDDFVRRVHNCRSNPNYSEAIQRCCDYIEMNWDKKIQAKDLASLVGYTEYYLTHKFKEETGVSVNDFIKSSKIQHAKFLLKNSDLNIQEISD